jgi:hypothetical protein
MTDATTQSQADANATPRTITFWYRNYRGEEGYRRVHPISVRFGTSEWHKEPQWLMLADDVGANDDPADIKRREFAMRDIQHVIGSHTLAFALGDRR